MTNPLKSGLQMIVDFVVLKYNVIEVGGNEDALPDFNAVEKQWTQELTAAKTFVDAVKKSKVQDSVIIGSMLGRDPFKQSRIMFRELKNKYEKS
jgi:hypothetical protein